MVRRRRPRDPAHDPLLVTSHSDPETQATAHSAAQVTVTPLNETDQSSHHGDQTNKPSSRLSSPSSSGSSSSSSSSSSSTSSAQALIDWDLCNQPKLIHISSSSSSSSSSSCSESVAKQPHTSQPSSSHGDDTTHATLSSSMHHDPPTTVTPLSPHAPPTPPPPQSTDNHNDHRHIPRFTRNERTDILNFILQENEKLKQKSQLLNGWFKKIKCKAKQTVWKQTNASFTSGALYVSAPYTVDSTDDADQVPAHHAHHDPEEEEEDEEDQWEQVNTLNTDHGSRSHEFVSLLSDSTHLPASRHSSSFWDQFISFLAPKSNPKSSFYELKRSKSSISNQSDIDPNVCLTINDSQSNQSSDDELVCNSPDAAFNFRSSRCPNLIHFSASPRYKSLKGKQQSLVEPNESRLAILLQVFFPFFIAGFGTVGAGLVLDQVQHWNVFQKITEVFILVPALLGLKGNLEMTLASRLSTQANLGHLDNFKSQWRMATGNMALIQCQSTVVGFLAALFAIAVNWLPDAQFNFDHALILCSASLLTACLASLLLGIIMIVVVIVSHKCKINPDNVATPIAASLGDLITLSILAYISNYLFDCLDDHKWVYGASIVLPLVTIPLWCVIAHHNEYTNEVLYSGWTPVITAMAISSVGGCILDFAVSRFKGIAVFQPVINGVGGNLAAVQASRISTYLHQNYKLGYLSPRERNLCLVPTATFFSKSEHSKTAQVLMLLVVPGHLVFTYGIRLLQAGHTSMTPIFLTFYLTAACIQVFILLYMAQIIIFWMWKMKIDPDNSAIPYLTALGDLIGTGLLALAFYTLYILGDKDTDVGD